MEGRKDKRSCKLEEQKGKKEKEKYVPKNMSVYSSLNEEHQIVNELCFNTRRRMILLVILHQAEELQ